jgi:transposase
MPKQYPRELRERTVRLVAEHRGEYETEYAAIRSVAARLGISTPETLRKWVRQAEVDGGQRPGVTSEESAEIRRLKRENAELRRASEILKAASAFFAAELDRRAGQRDCQDRVPGQRGAIP